jgi:hypothetical protein
MRAQVHPSWAPLGAARFRELVETQFYDGNRFFRVLVKAPSCTAVIVASSAGAQWCAQDGMYDIWIAQFGIHGTPATHAKWDRKMIRDDKKPNWTNKRQLPPLPRLSVPVIFSKSCAVQIVSSSL